ncbi:hypothetical protein KPK_1830 [Klebsiella variicola]|uniref:Uncharacterized protein n=1 Tax=Klebsiella variicola (strain 342) TaxID=507522 RepID=B5XPT1_KLEV3|nr:hypothetical protein KPK_1830 [Klebsiella variicola]
MNRDFFIGIISVQDNMHHTGILFLNSAGFRDRVIYVTSFDWGSFWWS